MRVWSKIIFSIVVVQIVLCDPEINCGYSACHPADPDKLNVHLIPHSHDDLGWLKTVNQYFYGTNIKMQRAGVQFILNSVVQALQDDPNRRFIQVETAFFWMWWKRQDEDMKNVFRKLVNTGQIEMVGGGWSMNDEAVTNYQSIIDQFTLGLKTLQDTLGKCGRPRVGWQIDPFGHSREMASIFSQLGFDGVLFPRVEYMEIFRRKVNKSLEFIWRGNPDLGPASDLFTNIMVWFYTAPDSFCWASTCKDEPIVDDKESPEYNLKERVASFASIARQTSQYYKTNNVLITMGGDFEYQSAHMQYKNMDRLIRGFKDLNYHEYNVMYSTPSCYIKAVRDFAERSKVNFTITTEDFLPYAASGDAYWTGFYTSRPSLKRYEKQANNFLQAVKQLTTFARVKGQDYSSNLTKLKEIMGIMQHHDAITGTAKQKVTNDYVRLISIGMEEAEKIVPEIMYELLSNKLPQDSNYVLPFETCIMANVSRCAPSQGDNFATLVYNPLGRTMSHYAQLPVMFTSYKIIDDEGNPVEYQISSNIETFPDVKYKEVTAAKYTLVFRAKNVPPLGLKLYYVYKEDALRNIPGFTEEKENIFKVGTEKTGLEIDPSTGFLSSVTMNGISVPIKQEFLFYSSSSGYAYGDSFRASGAYAFGISSRYPTARKMSKKLKWHVYTGPLFDEVHQIYNQSVKQIMRVYKEEDYIELDWIVGPLQYIDDHGVEVISRFTSSLNSGNYFYTDSNGRGLIRRTRGSNDESSASDIPSQYYPVTSRIVIKDEDRNLQLAVLNDRSQGGTSLTSGQVELMVHRKCKKDDGFFVDEVLNEIEFGKGLVVRGTHYLVLGTGEVTAKQQHDLVEKVQQSPWTFVAPIKSKEQHNKSFGDNKRTANEKKDSAENVQDRDYLSRRINFKFSGLVHDLPPNIKILTLETWDDNKILLRLEHTYSYSEHLELSKPASVNLRDLFSLFQIVYVVETTLGANQPIEENRKLKWRMETGNHTVTTFNYEKINEENFSIVVRPMEIRTFIIEVRLGKILLSKEDILYRDLQHLLYLSTLSVVLFFLFVMCNRRLRFYILRLRICKACITCVFQRIYQIKHR